MMDHHGANIQGTNYEEIDLEVQGRGHGHTDKEEDDGKEENEHGHGHGHGGAHTGDEMLDDVLTQIQLDESPEVLDNMAEMVIQYGYAS